MSPRPRNNKDHRPPYTELKNGRWYVREHLGKGKLGPRIYLCSGDASMSTLWKEWERITQEEHPDTLNWLIKKFLKSDQFKQRKPSTQRDYEKSLTSVKNFPTKSGTKFGEVRLKNIDVKVVRRWMDKRGQQAPVRCNRELAALSVTYSWAIERIDGIDINPCKGITRYKETPRDRYVEDWEYDLVYKLATERPGYIRPMMELAYLCRLRENEILKMKPQTHLLDEGVLCERGKGSKTQIVAWSPRLKKATNLAQQVQDLDITRTVIGNKRGEAILIETFRTAWGRLIKKAMTKDDGKKKLTESFTFHDLKAKGITDFDGDKQKAAGHKTRRIAEDVYNRKIEVVKSTK